MARNDRVSLLREQRGFQFRGCTAGFSGETFRLAGAASYVVSSLVLYVLVGNMVGDLRVRGANVAYP
jgi:hypothetical protein